MLTSSASIQGLSSTLFFPPTSPYPHTPSSPTHSLSPTYKRDSALANNFVVCSETTASAMPSRENSKEPEIEPKDASSEGKVEETTQETEVVQETPGSGSAEQAPEAASSSADALPSRRPQTRSQTGTVSKRRARDDADHLVANKKRAPPPRKRQKTSDSATVNDPMSSETPGSSSPKPPTTREMSLSSSTSSAVPPSTHTQLTFYHSSMSEDQSECRLPRSRASLPTPIPNLTKKSRGRRVPTKEIGTVDPEQKDSRLYVCTVEGCGKCFHRGEHLKRHIRSIHTHEKPFKCTFPLCEKFFNRHDNLLQHLKVHRQANSLPDAPPPVPKRSLDDEHYSAPLPHRRHRSYSPADEDDEPESPVAPLPQSTGPRTIYNAHTFPTISYNAYSAPVGVAYTGGNVVTHNHGHGTNALGPGPNEPISLITNMAVSSLRTEVSSLRTEIPHSPLDMRAGAPMQAGPY